ncbi:S24 family peptidase [Flavobacterium sp. ov086]|uniref:S24 family peptidase n=1 Tax=Flavobacterium sp. ov086 TaxID=1761785 RepID=UPI000B681624|nr:S24 family peptidase [Flavobacterium sp. ov086]SNR99271.1 Phage repressor protein C, contains Cro/C1-type HTH and peptisase s24 domains [Flavobacterium sp. ov086]
MTENTIKRIKLYLDFKSVRVSSFEREVGMSNGSFASQLKNNKTIGLDKLENILKIYTDINVEWLLTGDGNMLKSDISSQKNVETPKKQEIFHDITQIPLYDIQTITEISDLFDKNENQSPVDFIKIHKISNYDGALYMIGDSMYPLLNSGDIVIYKKINNPIENIIWGEMYLIYVNNDGNESFFTKYIKQSERENYVKLESQNPHHQTVEYPITSIKALALVKASIRINAL